MFLKHSIQLGACCCAKSEPNWVIRKLVETFKALLISPAMMSVMKPSLQAWSKQKQTLPRLNSAGKSRKEEFVPFSFLMVRHLSRIEFGPPPVYWKTLRTLLAFDGCCSKTTFVPSCYCTKYGRDISRW